MKKKSYVFGGLVRNDIHIHDQSHEEDQRCRDMDNNKQGYRWRMQNRRNAKFNQSDV